MVSRRPARAAAPPLEERSHALGDAVGERRQNGLAHGRRQPHADLVRGSIEEALEDVALLHQVAVQAAQQPADRLLVPPAVFSFTRRRPLLAGLGESLEGFLVLQAGDALRSRLEVEPERTLDGDLAEPKCVVGNTRLTTVSSSFPSRATRRVSPSLIVTTHT
jgi:hypothetical protein